MRKSRFRFLLAPLVVVAAGLVAFAIGRYAASDDTPAIAQIDPSGTPVIIERTPHPDIAAAITAIAEDNRKPLFIGELNGFTFVGPGTPFPKVQGGCSNAELRELNSSEAGAAIRGSGLDFEADDLPSGMSLTEETAVVCKDEVVVVQRVYEGSNDRVLTIGRARSEPVGLAIAPKDRLSPLTIRGRPSVLVVPLTSSGTILFMRDDEETFWTINAERMGVDETRQVAEGVE
jgi:hypothetical protein